MRFCAASMRSCFFIKKVWGLQVALLTRKGYAVLPTVWFFSVLDGNSYHLSNMFGQNVPTTKTSLTLKGAAKLGRGNQLLTLPKHY